MHEPIPESRRSDGTHTLRPVIIYYNGTFVHMRNGAHMRMASLLEKLIKQGPDIVLFSFANHPTEPWDEEAQSLFHQRYPQVRLVLDVQTGGMRRLTSLKNGLSSFFPAKARQILAMRKQGDSPEYEKLLAAYPGAVWIVNYADGLTQLNGLPSGVVIVETHDLKFVNVAKKENASPINIRSLLRMRSELGVLETVTGLVAISPIEAGFFRTVMNGPRTYYIPQYGANKRVAPPVRLKAKYEYDLLFVGSEMFQNARGLTRFLRENMDWVSDLRIAVAGKVGNDPEVRDLVRNMKNVELLGFVPDIASLYARSKAAISPVDGTGLKIKVIDALGHGLPVFGSAHTIEGLAPGYDACVFPINRTLMISLLHDDEKLEVARKAALGYWDGLSSAGDINAFIDYLREITVDGSDMPRVYVDVPLATA